MAIRADRIESDIRAIAACTHTPGNGATRPTFSAEWARARDYVIAQATALNFEIRIDAFGNVHARPAEIASQTNTHTKVWLCGSHIDTVPHGGDYDGVAGIVVALELLRSARDDGIVLPLELIIFAEEEGPTFGLGMLGARAWVGELSAERLSQLTNIDGKNYLEAGKPFGVDPTTFTSDRFVASNYLGLIELHIEQGPGMWRRDQQLAVVNSIAGRQQYKITLRGEANHAGATSMADRRDALACSAEIALMLETLAAEISGDAVCTIGRLSVLPNAINVIPDRVEFTIDFRAPHDDQLARGLSLIQTNIQTIATRRQIDCSVEVSESIPARPMNAKLVETFSSHLPLIMSGALHDSAVMAPHMPTVMLFVPSKDGISHNSAEFSRFDDIAAGASLIEKLVRRPTLEQLNLADQKHFVSVCGRFYEHSPWVAERAWEVRPFTSVRKMIEAMSRTVRDASPDEKMQLIQAHPDLVGKLARENKLTAESSHEQTSAGLTTLNVIEVEDFESFNAAYKDRFGFPFIICARMNKKDAILAAFPLRLRNSRDAEIQTALSEIDNIAMLRASDAIWESEE